MTAAVAGFSGLHPACYLRGRLSLVRLIWSSGAYGTA